LASPLSTLSSGDPKLFAQIANLLVEYEPITIYVGEPLNLSGQSSTSAQKATAFADKLRTEFQIPVTMIDERLSTITAINAMRQSGVNAKDSRNKVDMAAAVAILEQGLAIEKAKDA
jgi:putative Holliday junction resolvase